MRVLYAFVAPIFFSKRQDKTHCVEHSKANSCHAIQCVEKPENHLSNIQTRCAQKRIMSLVSLTAGLAAPSGKNLWEFAIKELSVQEIECVNSNCKSDLNIRALLVELQQVAIDTRTRSEAGRWTIKRTNKTPIVLRDKFDQIVTWVGKFIKIIDSAVQYDPGHAALPWAGVKLILQVILTDHQTFGAVVEGMERISNLISRYAIFEDLYLNPELKSYDGLERALIELYLRIFKYLSKAIKFYKKGTATRLVDTIKNSAEKFEPLLLNIIQQESEVERFAKLADAEGQEAMAKKLGTLASRQSSNYNNLKSLLAELRVSIVEMKCNVSDLHNDRAAPNQRDVLMWLSTIPYAKHHDIILHQNSLKDSGLWLFQKSEYDNWEKSGTGKFLWLRGIPGSGKTKLVSLVISHLQSTINRDSEYVAYFYCVRNTAEPERGNPEEILRSILRQLSCSDPIFPIHELVQKAYIDIQDQGFGPRKLTLDETSKLIIDVINTYSSVTIVIDALDECNVDTRSTFLGALKDISKESATPVKILVSSRDDGDTLFLLNDSLQVRIGEEDNAVDIERFVHHQVEECIRKK